MRRIVLIPLLLLVAALPASAPAAVPAAPTGTGMGTLDSCHAATVGGERYAIFRGDMSSVKGSVRMAMRFDVMGRAPGDVRWSAVDAPKLGVWDRSRAGVDRFTYTKQVTNLAGPGDYRARITFRWIDAAGDVIARDSELTATCTMPDLRPDLEPGALTAQPAGVLQPGMTRYSVPVRNAGRSDAGPFDVVFTINGASRSLVSVSGLAAGDSAPIQFVAPACVPGDVLRVTVDPNDAVAEVDERDNTLMVSCPA